MSADKDDLREYAHRLAMQCIEQWHYEDRWENNDTWGTDFTDEEMDEIVRLAGRAKVVIPE